MMESTVIREDASTESRLLLKQMCGSFGSKTKKRGRKVYQQNTNQGRAVCRMGQEFSSICYRQSQITFLIVEHLCKINLIGYLLM